MNVSLTPELEKLIQVKVNTGLYNSASEVVREGLRLLFEKDLIRKQQLQELNNDIQIGLDAAENGQLSRGEEVYKRIKARKN